MPLTGNLNEHYDIYLIGSLRNPQVPTIGKFFRENGYTVFDDWFAAGPEADDWWQKYEQSKGQSYLNALYSSAAADNVFNFDKRHLDRSSAAILVMPAGKSGHLELGYMAGKGKFTGILFDKEPERWDVMYKFVDVVATCKETMLSSLGRYRQVYLRPPE